MKINKSQKYDLLIILLCIGILLPIIAVGFFNRPAADDYDYALLTYAALQNGGNIFDVIKAAWQTNINYYNTWQGLYTSAFLLALQPGIFGEKYYAVAHIIVLLVTFLPLFASVNIINKHYFKKSTVFSLSFSLVIYTMLMMWLPDIGDGIYWYNGAMNYTPYAFTNVLTLCLMLEAGTTDSSKKKIIYIAAGTVIAFLTSGGNHVTAFANIMLLFIACIIAFSKKKFFPLIPFAAACIGFIIMFSAPGTAVRQGYFQSPGVVKTIVKTALHVHGLAAQWISLKWLVSLLVLTPFAVEFGHKNKNRFPKKFPLYILAALVASVAVICGMFCVPYYAMADFGMGRVTNVIWITFSFLSWFVYFITVGWLTAADFLNSDRIIAIRHIAVLRLLCIVFGLCCTVAIFENDRACWSIKAASEIVHGNVQGYCQEMDARIALYNDKTLSSVEVSPIQHKSEFFTAFDVTEDPNIWPNTSIGIYYGKTVTLKEQ